MKIVSQDNNLKINKQMKKILTPFKKNGLELKNHLVMAPMTRSRALNNIPNDLMAEYYGQRTGAGLIIAEGTAPMKDGVGYPRIPGIYSDGQIEGWKKVTDAVHKKGSKIFLQLMHCGRIAHEDNIPEGGKIMAPSAIKAEGEMYTDTKGLQDHTKPEAYTKEEVKKTIEGHIKAAENAIKAGFDGVEIHAAHGYLIEQFLNPHVNKRDDEYGGTVEKRARFVVEIVNGIAAAIGKEKTGIRLSPYNKFNDQPAYDKDEVHETYRYLTEKIADAGILYIHLSMNEDAQEKTYKTIREKYQGIIIQCNGLSPETAEKALHGEVADLVAFARNWLANPDLEKRIAEEADLNEPKQDLFYSPGAEGYTDYPTLKQEALALNTSL